jgi:carboxypeptidase family protein
VVRTNRLVYLLGATMLFMAGCSGGGPKATVGGAAPDSTVGVDAAGTGRIMGTILDEETLPIEGAQAGLSQAGQTVLEATTDANGGFTMLGVAPGSYTLQASKLGFESFAVKIDVKEGETQTPELRLKSTALNLPHPVLLQQQGYVQCSVRAYPGAPLTGVPGVVGLAPGWYSGAAACNVTSSFDVDPPGFGEDKFLLEWKDVPAGVQEMFLEMTWTSTQATGRGLQVALEHSDHINDGTPIYGTDIGVSPLSVYADRAQMAKVGTADKVDCAAEACEITTRVFAAANTTGLSWPTDPPSVPIFGPPSKRIDAALIIDQKFDQYLTLFVGMDKPADYTVLGR